MDSKEVIRDFHLHTVYSDGLFTPRRLVGEAAKQGVRELAITDHNTIDGLSEGQEAAATAGMTLVPGVEMSTSYEGRETHILGYGFNPLEVQSASQLYNYMQKIKRADDAWAIKVAQLSQKEPIVVELGGGRRGEIAVSVEELERFRQSTKASYFHFGILIKEKMEALAPAFKAVPARHIFYYLFWRKSPEYLEQYEAFFKTYGIENRKYWHVPREETSLQSTKQVIEMIERVGGIPVIAHPAESGLIEKQIEDISAMGAKGIEVYTPKHDAGQTEYYEAVAENNGLFTTSGTDFHDPFHRNRVQIGRDRDGRPLTNGVSAEDMRRIRESRRPSIVHNHETRVY
jgi:predicted metal-dependent phosphoesterase TrpH